MSPGFIWQSESCFPCSKAGHDEGKALLKCHQAMAGRSPCRPLTPVQAGGLALEELVFEGSPVPALLLG